MITELCYPSLLQVKERKAREGKRGALRSSESMPGGSSVLGNRT